MNKEFFPPRSESQGDSSIQPKVAEPARLPWVRHQNKFNPNGVASNPRRRCNPVGVGKILVITKPRVGATCANPGLKAAIPLGLSNAPLKP